MRKLLATLAALAAGCSVIGHQKVEGWPQLEIVEHCVAEFDLAGGLPGAPLGGPGEKRGGRGKRFIKASVGCCS